MMESYSFTFKFGEIFEDYASFKAFTDEIGITSEGVEDDFNEFFFNRLWCKYFDRDVAFATKENFLRLFSNEYINQYNKYKKAKTLVESIYDLSLEDLLSNGIVVSNMSGNDSANLTDVFKPLNYVINQNSSKSEMPKLQGYLQALNSIPDLQVDNYIDRFGYLFLPYVSSYSVLY